MAFAPENMLRRSVRLRIPFACLGLVGRFCECGDWEVFLGSSFISAGSIGAGPGFINGRGIQHDTTSDPIHLLFCIFML